LLQIHLLFPFFPFTPHPHIVMSADSGALTERELELRREQVDFLRMKNKDLEERLQHTEARLERTAERLLRVQNNSNHVDERIDNILLAKGAAAAAPATTPKRNKATQVANGDGAGDKTPTKKRAKKTKAAAAAAAAAPPAEPPKVEKKKPHCTVCKREMTVCNRDPVCMREKERRKQALADLAQANGL
jgi:hypothetical protein